MSLLKNKNILITGIANRHSIAYHIASAFYKEGAKLAFAYQEALEERVQKIVKEEFSKSFCAPMDAGSDESMQAFFEKLKTHWSSFDGIVHAIAFAPKDQLSGDFLSSINREGFQIAHNISSYSFSALAKYALPTLNSGASLITLTYLASHKVVQQYNVMALAKASLEANVRYMANSLGPKNIRVNAISAGPVYTLAAYGIHEFRKILNWYAKHSPMQRLANVEEISNVASFLCSPYSSGVTGEIIHVDAGFHMMLPIE